MTNILVVDDDPAVLHFTALLLKSEGHNVTTADRGKDALEIIADDDPDLLVLDLSMPEMDGATVCRLARGAGYEHPVLVLSAAADAPQVCRELRVEAFLQKPFDPEVLLDYVDQLLPSEQST
jgi:CheY-like chemotaxis protein